MAPWLALPLAAVSLAAVLCAAPAIAATEGDADALFARRSDLDAAVRAAKIWKGRLDESPTDYEVACKLARARFYIGERSPRRERASEYKQGVEAARVAIGIDSSRPDGHFWLGTNLGALATVSSRLGALRHCSQIREAFEAALARDPAFGRGAAFCALGKYYGAVPGIFGGDEGNSEELLRRCLEVDPGSTVGHYYLGQTLVAQDRTGEAIAALRAAIDAPLDPDYVPEQRLWKQRAERLLAKVEAADGTRSTGDHGSP
jgi:tetratricopeptide (TPR) repeat protein